LVVAVTEVVPDDGEIAIISGSDKNRPTFKTGTFLGELPTAEPEN
jgi:hypothetical protein